MEANVAKVPRNSIWGAIWRATRAGSTELLYTGRVPGTVLEELRKGGYTVTDDGASVLVLL